MFLLHILQLSPTLADAHIDLDRDAEFDRVGHFFFQKFSDLVSQPALNFENQFIMNL